MVIGVSASDSTTTTSFGLRPLRFLGADKIATMTLSNVAGSVSYGSLSLDFQLRDLS